MNTQQLNAIIEGKLLRGRLIRYVESAVNSELGIEYPHTYIFSPPGLGKTYTVMNELRKKDAKFIEISGAQTMFAFGIHLSTIKYMIPDEKIIIAVDDCDSLFKNEENINIMKNVLAGNKVFSYRKSIESQFKSLSELQIESVQSFRNENQMGFQIPTENFVFIFTSNLKLPTDDEAFDQRSKSSISSMKTHLNAIRSRCNTLDFDLSKRQHYGWISEVVLNEFNHIDDDLKHKIIDWLWINWDNLNERSIRTIEKMIQSFKLDKEGYEDIWNIDFLNVSDKWM